MIQTSSNALPALYVPSMKAIFLSASLINIAVFK